MIREYDLTGRLAVVTGGAAGIGRAIAEVLAEAGATIVVADRDEVAGLSLAERLGGHALALDVTDAKAAEAAAMGLVLEHGAPDILVNNAGIVVNAPALDVDLADWHRVLDVNLHGVFHTSRAFGRHMVAAGKGAVVNIS
ncbi:MAG: SDR family NAD(P)-dependent oxidoreductase, partial [Paracoccus sp. (in: a-proteobacteria)]|nr:SDR family NAD(P)-dependent oxidoreductase [Paracoccus sp. (in: a-proteobacteria)]